MSCDQSLNYQPRPEIIVKEQELILKCKIMHVHDGNCDASDTLDLTQYL